MASSMQRAVNNENAENGMMKIEDYSQDKL